MTYFLRRHILKIEKISENKLKIILTLDELEKREISLKDLENDTTLAKELFLELIEENNLDEEFKLDNSQLLIEASSDCENLFVVTITKLDINVPLTQNQETLTQKGIVKSNSDDYTLSSNIYSFSSMDTIIDFCKICKSHDLFYGRNSLYKFSSDYYLIFSKNCIKNKKFIRTFSFISEYCKSYYNMPLLETSIKEKAKLIIKNNAIDKLSKI